MYNLQCVCVFFFIFLFLYKNETVIKNSLNLSPSLTRFFFSSPSPSHPKSFPCISQPYIFTYKKILEYHYRSTSSRLIIYHFISRTIIVNIIVKSLIIFLFPLILLLILLLSLIIIIISVIITIIIISISIVIVIITIIMQWSYSWVQ